MNPLILKYAVIAILVAVMFGATYYKGVSDTSAKYDLLIAEQQIEQANKLAKVEALSASIAQTLIVSTVEANAKLDSIVKLSKPKVLTSVPCEPSKDFVETWNQLNKETK